MQFFISRSAFNLKLFNNITVLCSISYYVPIIVSSTIFIISLINLDFDTIISKVKIVMVGLFILLLRYKLALYSTPLDAACNIFGIQLNAESR